METMLSLTHKEFLQVDRDHEKAASAAHLVYVNGHQPGIVRCRKGKGFTYLFDNRPIKDKKEIERIRKLVIPPAWTNVWICTSEKGHIQATGLDLRGRKQYRYYPLRNSLRNETKFHRLSEFGKVLPLLRTRLEEDLRSRGLTQERVLATVVSLMERTFIRVGNHVAITGDKLVFSFTGKKGVHHDVTLRNKRLARIVSQCHDIRQDFTAKDFRTWAGSLHALQAFRGIGEALTATDMKKNINLVLDSSLLSPALSPAYGCAA